MNKRKLSIILLLILIITIICFFVFNIKVVKRSYVEGEGLKLKATDLKADSKTESVMKANTKHLQECINKVSEAGGGIVDIPAGTYYFASAGRTKEGKGNENYVIECKNNVLVQGAGVEGASATILKPYGQTEYGLDMFYYNKYADNDFIYEEEIELYLINADFKNFIIDSIEATGKAKYNSTGKGFMINLLKDCDWENVVVKNTDATGFGMDCPINCTIKNCKAMNCGNNASTTDVGASGFGIGTGFSDDEYMYISNCESTGNKKYGFFFEHQGIWGDNYSSKYKARKSKGFVVADCVASGNMYDFGGNKAYDLTYENCTSLESNNSNNVVSPMHFEADSRRVYVQNCEIEGQFTDVNATDYWYEPIYWGRDNGIVEGNNKKQFAPGTACTRAEALEFLYRMAGRPLLDLNFTEIQTGFEDVDATVYTSYAAAVKWALGKGIITGLNKTPPTFSPGENITRADFITMLWRYDGEKKVSGSNPFKDIDSNAYYKDAVVWAYNKKIATGETDTLFNPEEACKRGDIITWLHRYQLLEDTSFPIIYNLQGGTVSTKNPETYKSGEKNITLNNPTKTGYTFEGWIGKNYTTASPTKKMIISKEDKGNKVFSAIWTANNYKVSFNANGGTGSMSNQTLTYDNQRTLTANNFTREGYTFKDWNTKADGTGTSYANKKAVKNLATTGTITLYAQWTANNYKVSFNANGGTGSMSNQDLTYDKASNLTANNFKREGYTFKDWNTKANGTGTSYANKEAVKNLATTGSITLYAQWTANNYKVSFNANGGTGAMSNQDLTYDKASNLTANNFKREGYEFKAWNTKANGTGTSYANKEAVKNLATTGTVTLYAQWRETTSDIEEIKNIFIGDSGFVEMHNIVGGNDIWSAKRGEGIDWFKTTGLPAVEDEIGEDTNIIIQIGTNDLFNYYLKDGKVDVDGLVEEYANYFNAKAVEWKEVGANVYFVSMGPFDDSKIDSTRVVNNSDAVEFNNKMKSKLSGITYIDTYSPMIEEFNAKNPDLTRDDGTHGTALFYAKKYDIIKEALNQSYTPTYEALDNMNDVPTNAEYIVPLKWAYENVYIDPILESEFGANESCTKADVLDFIWRSQGIPYVGYSSKLTHTDIDKNALYYDAIVWAVENEISSGYTSSTFAPEEISKRGDYITFIWKLAGSPIVSTGNNFSDVEENKSYTSAINWAVNVGIINKNLDGKFEPEAVCTREDAITFLYNYYHKYSITYNLDGGNLANTQNPATYISGIDRFTLNNPTKEGNTFNGWTGSNGQIPQKEVIIEKETEGNLTYIANWLPYNRYSIIYNYQENGGKEASKQNDQKASGEAIDLSVKAQKDGYEFVGWNTDKDAITGLSTLTMGTEDITLYAIFKKDIKLTFIDYKGTTRTETTKELTIYNKNTGTVTAPILNEYTGWDARYWTKEGTSNAAEDVANGGNITDIQDNATYYGRYTKQIAVTFNLNGGNGTTPVRITGNVETNSKNISAVTKVRITIPNIDASREGYKISSWNTKADGTGTDYTAGDSVEFKSDTTLYVKWRKNLTDTIYNYLRFTLKHIV